MDDDRIPIEDRQRQLEQHVQHVVDHYAQQLRTAPDELGRLTSAILSRDDAAVVQLALATQDPVSYGLALRACASLRGPGCAALTPQRWAQLDPSNAAAWWAVAAASRNTASAAEAMKRASTATHTLSLDHVLLKRAAAVPGSGPEQLLPLTVVALGLDAAFAAASSSALRAACGSTPPEDAQRREQCLRFALDTARREPSAHGKWLVSLKAEQWGARPDQLERTSQQWKGVHDAIENWRTPERLTEAGAMSCDSARQMAAFDLASAEAGDLAAFERLQRTQGAAAQR